MNINKLTGQELDDWVRKALLLSGATLNGEFSPLKNYKHCFELMEFYDISILRVPNTKLIQCRAQCRIKDEGIFVAYAEDRMTAICRAAVGFMFDSISGPHSYEELCEMNQKIIEEEMGDE